MDAKRKRRSREEVAKAVAEINALRASGMSLDAASDKVGLARSVYDRSQKPPKPKVGRRKKVTRGTVSVGSLPPRPARGGKRPAKPVNMNDVGSVAGRIARIDNKLKLMAVLKHDRERLVSRLMVLLKSKA